MKAKRLSPDQFKAAFRGLPKIEHEGAHRVAPEVLDEFRCRFREAVLDRGTLTKDQWKLARGSGNGPMRTDAIEALVYSAFQRFEPRLILNHFPPASVSFTLRRNIVSVKWVRLELSEIERRIVYHFPDRPRVRILSGDWIAGFSHHALIRLVDHFAVNSTTARVTLANLLRGMKAEPHEDQAGFWLWGTCNTTLLKNAASILASTDDPQDYQFRLAFCPTHFLGKFARAKTVLPPAFLIDGIQSPLLTFDKLATYQRRNWEELLKLHDRLPMVRKIERQPERRGFNWEPQRIRIDDPTDHKRGRNPVIHPNAGRDRGKVS